MISTISYAFRPYASQSASGHPQQMTSSKPVVDAKTAEHHSDSRNISELTEDEKLVIDQLKKTDQEVRAHEQAHKNAGGQYAGSASFGYTNGPDGKRYAVSGEVPIDIAPVEGDPKATIAKMSAVMAAALAPAKPSAQDRNVAARAMALRAEAQSDLSRTSGEDKLVSDFQDGQSGSGQKNMAVGAYDASNKSGAKNDTTGLVLNVIS